MAGLWVVVERQRTEMPSLSGVVMKMRVIGSVCYFLSFGCTLLCTGVHAADYRIVPSSSNLTPGATVQLSVEVVTKEGDNLIGVGHYAFSVDLVLGGTANVTGSNVNNVAINTAFFDDSLATSLGAANGGSYINTGGATIDVAAPNFGAAVGDVLQLFTFDLSIPAGAVSGDTVTVSLSEGGGRNVIVNDDFDVVAPQVFTGAEFNIVPEPTTALLTGAGGMMCCCSWRRKRSRG